MTFQNSVLNPGGRCLVVDGSHGSSVLSFLRGLLTGSFCFYHLSGQKLSQPGGMLAISFPFQISSIVTHMSACLCPHHIAGNGSAHGLLLRGEKWSIQREQDVRRPCVSSPEWGSLCCSSLSKDRNWWSFACSSYLGMNLKPEILDLGLGF